MPAQPAATTVIAAVTAKGIRFTALGNVKQLRLDIFTTEGGSLGDSDFRAGNVYDWSLGEKQNQGLRDGTYQFVITITDLSGHLSIKQCMVVVQGRKIALSLGAAEPAEATEVNKAVAIASDDTDVAVTLATHTGTEGQLNRTRGALTFKVGDFFSGKDQEQMRLTPQGYLGIGTSNPRVRLDVDGDIRASGTVRATGIEFPDGTVQTTGASGRWDAAGELIPSAPSSVELNRIAKSIDTAGTLGNSLIVDTGTQLQLTAPPTTFDANLLYLNSTEGTIGMLAGSAPSYGAANGPFFALRGNTFTKVPNQRGLLAIGAGNVSNPVGDEGSVKFNTGDDILRMIIKPSGNVGIGTINPQSLLEVAGNIRVSGSGNALIFPDGTSQSTASIGGSSGSGTPGVIPKWIGTNALGNSEITQSGNTVNLGTTSSVTVQVPGNLNVVGTISGNISGANLTNLNASNISSGTLDNARLGIVPVNKGGTGLTTAGPSGNFLRSNGTTFISSALQASDIPPLSTNYIQNQTTGPQVGGFNISGNGTAGGTFAGNIVNATTQFNIANARILSVPGTDNTFLGNGAGTSNSLGTNNSFFGRDAGINNTTGSNNSFFASDTGFGNTSGSNNSFFGSVAGNSNTGSNNSFYGYRAASTNLTGSNNTIIGAFAGVGTSGLSFATAIGSYAEVNASDTIVLGKTAGTYPGGGSRLADTVIVRGWLQLDALATAGGNSLCWNNIHQVALCSSSLRYKKNIAPFSTGLSLVQRLHPIHFEWKDGGMQDIGFAAEDVADIEPLLVTHNAKGEVEGVKYDRISAVLVNAVKEQQAQIGAQQTQLKQQQEQLSAQQQQIKKQQSLIDGLKELFVRTRRVPKSVSKP
jgi:hypothetical protein